MKNVLKPESKHAGFTWSGLGDIKKGRVDLGEEMPVIIYRLMQFTMLDILTKDLGYEKANDYFREAGFLAGTEFTKNLLNTKVDFNSFAADLQKALKELKVGIMRIESFEETNGEIVLTVEQDLDCSGLPVTNEVVCSYDEGFIAGILEAYTNKPYMVREVDCWANGARICRFLGKVIG